MAVIQCFNTQPPEGGCAGDVVELAPGVVVSTHSRPKAAAIDGLKDISYLLCFNTQPPEGGCHLRFNVCVHDT